MMGLCKQLVEFSFVSQAAGDLPPSVFLRLARQAWSFNTRMGLTGALRLRRRTFVQVIEGPCELVQPLAARILADPRHRSIRISAFRELRARRYEGWVCEGFEAEGPAPEIPFVKPANLRCIPAVGSSIATARGGTA